MNKIKESITALAAGDFSRAVHISRQEQRPMTDERFELVLKCVTRVSTITSVTVLVLNIETAKLVAVMGFAIFFSLIYFGLKD